MSPAAASWLECAACGWRPGAREPYPFRCARAGDGADHVVARRLGLEGARFPRGGEGNPFLRYRGLLHSFHVAQAGGMGEGEFMSLVQALDLAVAGVDGRGFVHTPCARVDALGEALRLAAPGGVWVKDETRNVSGSHKARHLFGLALWLEVVERLGWTTRAESDRRGLAIASCGNAALAAAVVARATGRPLEVFIPADANPRVVERLQALGARVAVCPREAGVPGDPCVHGFHRALARGALPFCVQGNENGLTIEGGQTLAWELVSSLAAGGMAPDRLFVQVGGGALASACVQGLREAVVLGALPRLPRIHAVQTRGAWPLRRAYERLRTLVLARLGAGESQDGEAAETMRQRWDSAEVRESLRQAQTDRAAFMWPWEEAPHSIAHGILDDETYDWHAVVAGMIESGGWPVTVGEGRLREAHVLARAVTPVRADATGAAGLAGLLELRRADLVPPHERAVVLLTGVER